MMILLLLKQDVVHELIAQWWYQIYSTAIIAGTIKDVRSKYDRINYVKEHKFNKQRDANFILFLV